MALEDLRNIIKETPISTIISHYRPLVKKGSSTLCICPFHNDSNPSMNVNDQKGLFRCFACDVGGDAITFVQKYDRVEFVDALKNISKILGLNFDDYVEQKKTDPEREMAIKILTKSIQIYRKIALENQKAKFQNFITNRDVSIEASQKFQLGFASASNTISEYLSTIPNEKERSFALNTAVKIGIIKLSNRQGQSHYDTFRDRIIFPIWDQFGKPQGFTSRSIREDQKPKYLNSLESFIFKKKSLLYGLNIAKSYIREKDSLILCEGNMDAITLHQFGFKNSIAIMGTAFTSQSLSIFKGLTKNIILALDSDQSGFEASQRANKMFMEEGILPKYIDFEKEKDPDEFLKTHGALALGKKLENAQPFIDVLLESLLPDDVPSLIDKKYEVLKSSFDVLSPLKKSISATERILQIAKKVGLKSEPTIILKEYYDYLDKNKAPVKTYQNQSDKPSTNQNHLGNNSNLVTSEIAVRDKIQNTAKSRPFIFTNSLKNLIKNIILHPECLAHESLKDILDLVWSNEVKKYVATLKALYFEVDESEYPQMIQETIKRDDVPVEIKETVGAMLFHYKYSPIDEKIVGKMLNDIKVNIEKDKLKLKRDELVKMQQQTNELEDVNQILKELSDIQKQLLTIKSQTHRN